MLAVGFSHRKVRQRLQVGAMRPHYPQGQQAVNILASGAVWLTGFGIASPLANRIRPRPSFVLGRFSGGTSETPVACFLHSSFFHPANCLDPFDALSLAHGKPSDSNGEYT
jgi:hypothetical protein